MNRRELLRRLAAGVLGTPIMARMGLADVPHEAVPGAVLNKDQRTLMELLAKDFVPISIERQDSVGDVTVSVVEYAPRREFSVGLEDVANDMLRHAVPSEFEVTVQVEEIDVTLLGQKDSFVGVKQRVRVRYVG